MLGKHKKATEILLAHGADPNIKTIGGDTVLHLAVDTELNQIVSLLLSYDADPNSVNIDGNTPLHIACF